MRDEIKEMKDNECYVFNIDHSSNNGTHWTCLFSKNGESYYFDSFGIQPPLEVVKHCPNNHRLYNTFQIQKPNEVICGHYCIYVLYRLSNGYKFDDVLDELYNFNN